jgi:KDO2-lipid IV(A) lauroyltransferase
MSLRGLKNNVIFVLVAGIFAFMQALPLRWARGLGSRLGRLFFLLVPYERKKSLRMLATAFPGKSDEQRFSLAKDSMAHLGRSGAEFMRFGRMKPSDLDAWIDSVHGFEHFEQARRQGRGIVAVTAHLGHWELLASWVAARMPTAVVARQIYDPRLDEKLNQIREHMGFTVFPRNTSIKPILRWLKDGNCLGVLADQDTSIDSLFVDLFGKKAKTPSGPAWLARASGADLMTAFSGRQANGKYRLEFEEAIAVPPKKTGQREELMPCVQEYTRRTEAAIRKWPDQYAWIHDRWRTRPENEE